MSATATRRDHAGRPVTWIGRLRGQMEETLPYDKLLPEAQPSYVASWIYVFGVLTLVALAMIVASGVVLSLQGPAWYHLSSTGLFVNSLHFWSVQLFFMFMTIHLIGNFWMAAWRGNRAKTWISGMFCFLVAIFAGLTGYVLQTNFDSQWIAFEAKDGLNAVGLGAWFNVANLGQMMLMHVFLLPAVIALLVLVHVLLVRVHGVVPPLDAAEVEEARTGSVSDEGVR